VNLRGIGRNKGMGVGKRRGEDRRDWGQGGKLTGKEGRNGRGEGRKGRRKMKGRRVERERGGGNLALTVISKSRHL